MTNDDTDHAHEAERLLAAPGADDDPGAALTLAAAQAHATLAVADAIDRQTTALR